MITYNSDFEKLRIDYERGKIAENDLTEEQMNNLIEYYKKEIETNKIDINIIDRKIKNLKNKIDNLV